MFTSISTGWDPGTLHPSKRVDQVDPQDPRVLGSIFHIFAKCPEKNGFPEDFEIPKTSYCPMKTLRMDQIVPS